MTILVHKINLREPEFYRPHPIIPCTFHVLNLEVSSQEILKLCIWEVKRYSSHGSKKKIKWEFLKNILENLKYTKYGKENRSKLSGCSENAVERYCLSTFIGKEERLKVNELSLQLRKSENKINLRKKIISGRK